MPDLLDQWLTGLRIDGADMRGMDEVRPDVLRDPLQARAQSMLLTSAASSPISVAIYAVSRFVPLNCSRRRPVKSALESRGV